MLNALYRPSLALLTDLYQLTMAQGYWKDSRAGMEACFHLFFRKNPFKGGFTISCGLGSVVEYVENFRFAPEDVEYLGSLCGNDGAALFAPGFLEYLAKLEMALDVEAIPEGTVVFPHEPLVRVTGPLVQCQLMETPLLNLVNFQTLIATKAARVCMAARGEPVLEFGLRRAQGIDGSLSASRAAYIGGCAGTSNVLAGRFFGIPVKGTHAHSWVMCFDEELEAFKAYARAMPNNCVFLVDTYDTVQGVKNAIEVGNWLRGEGHEMVGVRLDSGDLAWLSIEARRLLDEAGFEKAAIVASNDLDESIITSLKDQGARIGVWGVGTKLATAYDQPALGGVYKLSAIREAGGAWQYKVKLSEQVVKVSNPGRLQVRRYLDERGAVADAIYDQGTDMSGSCTIVDPMDPTRRKDVSAGAKGEDLLIPLFRGGKRVHDPASISEARQRSAAQLELFHSGVKRLTNPHKYPVGLEKTLFELKQQLILSARGIDS